MNTYNPLKNSSMFTNVARNETRSLESTLFKLKLISCYAIKN